MRCLLLMPLLALDACCLENSCNRAQTPPCTVFENTAVAAVAATGDGGAVVLTTHTSDKNAAVARLRKLDASGGVTWTTQLGAGFTTPSGDARLAVLAGGQVIVWLGARLGGFDPTGRALWDTPAHTTNTPAVFTPVSAQAVQIVSYKGTSWSSYQAKLDGTTTSDQVLALSHDNYKTDLQRTSDGGFLLTAIGGVQKLDGAGALQWMKTSPDTDYSFLSHEVADGFLVLANVNSYSGLLLWKVTKNGATAATLFRDDAFSILAPQPFAMQNDSVATSKDAGGNNSLIAYNLDGTNRFTQPTTFTPAALVPDAAGGYLYPTDADASAHCHEIGALLDLRGANGSTAWQVAIEP